MGEKIPREELEANLLGSVEELRRLPEKRGSERTNSRRGEWKPRRYVYYSGDSERQTVDSSRSEEGGWAEKKILDFFYWYFQKYKSAIFVGVGIWLVIGCIVVYGAVKLDRPYLVTDWLRDTLLLIIVILVCELVGWLIDIGGSHKRQRWIAALTGICIGIATVLAVPLPFSIYHLLAAPTAYLIGHFIVGPRVYLGLRILREYRGIIGKIMVGLTVAIILMGNPF